MTVTASPLSGGRVDVAADALGDSDTSDILTALPGVDAEAGGGISSRPVVHGLGDSLLRGQIGRDVALLMERECLGRTPHFAEMELEPSAPPGHVVTARVIASDGRRLHGRPLAPMSAP